MDSNFGIAWISCGHVLKLNFKLSLQIKRNDFLKHLAIKKLQKNDS